MSRDDIHRIAVLDPADYSLIASEDRDPDSGYFEFLNEVGPRAAARINYLDTPHYSRYQEDEANRFERLCELLDGEVDICRVCGQNHGNRYWGFFEHIPTGDIIQVGSLCASKVGLADRAELEEIRAHESRNLALLRGQWLAGDPVHKRVIDWAWRQIPEGAEVNRPGNRLIYEENGFPSEFAGSVLAYFNREGCVTERMVELALRLQEEEPERIAREEQIAREKAEEPDPAPVIEGKIEIVGKVIGLGTKEYPTRYGTNYRGVMTVLDDRGFKVWGTRPQALYGSERGDRVQFTATVSASDRDETFGFFKRPSKASFLD